MYYKLIYSIIVITTEFVYIIHVCVPHVQIHHDHLVTCKSSCYVANIMYKLNISLYAYQLVNRICTPQLSPWLSNSSVRHLLKDWRHSRRKRSSKRRFTQHLSLQVNTCIYRSLSGDNCVYALYKEMGYIIVTYKSIEPYVVIIW